VSDREYFGYDGDDNHHDTNTDHKTYGTETDEVGTNEMARNAVERFLESETSDYIAGYESRRRGRPERSERERRTIPPHSTEKGDGSWGSITTASYDDNSDEYMARLANIRRDRPRRDKETTPTPNPAVRVNEERHYSTSTTTPDWPDEAETDWPGAEDPYSFKYRTDETAITPREAMVKEPRPRGTVPVHRRDPAHLDSSDGPNPLRYLLAFMFVGVLFLMAILAVNNRNLRQNIDTYRIQIARVEDNAVALELANLEIVALEETLDEYRLLNQQQDSQLEALGFGQGEEEELPLIEEDVASHSPPSSETTPYEPEPPPPAAPEYTVHIVQAGETLSHIALRHFGSRAQTYIDLIASANNITNPSLIREGDRLNIPTRE